MESALLVLEWWNLLSKNSVIYYPRMVEFTIQEWWNLLSKNSGIYYPRMVEFTIQKLWNLLSKNGRIYYPRMVEFTLQERWILLSKNYEFYYLGRVKLGIVKFTGNPSNSVIYFFRNGETLCILQICCRKYFLKDPHYLLLQTHWKIFMWISEEKFSWLTFSFEFLPTARVFPPTELANIAHTLCEHMVHLKPAFYISHYSIPSLSPHCIDTNTITWLYSAYSK